MDIDVSQWINHAVAIVFGGAGGIGATFARFRSTIKGFEDRVIALEKELAVSKERDKDRVATIESLSKELAAFRQIYGQHQSAVEHSLGSIEGTVNQIAKNGCANRCVSNIRYPVSVSDFPPKKPGPKT